MTDLPLAEDLDDEPPLDEEDDAALEARAKQMGWKPLAEFRGDPRRWTDARTFIEHGETELPILREQSRRMGEKLVKQSQQLTALQNTVAEQAQAVKDAMNLARRADKTGYDRAMAELKAERATAVEAGDTVAFDQIQERIEALADARTEVEPAPAPAPKSDEPQTPDPAITAFVKTHKAWWNKNVVLTRDMVAMHRAVVAEEPDMDEAERLDIALDRLKATYPHLFKETPVVPTPEPEDDEDETPPPRRRATVLPPGGGQRPVRQPGSKIDSIADADERKEARRAFQSMQRQDEGFSEAEYMQLYENPHLDALALRAQRKKA